MKYYVSRYKIFVIRKRELYICASVRVRMAPLNWGEIALTKIALYSDIGVLKLYDFSKTVNQYAQRNLVHLYIKLIIESCFFIFGK